MDASQLFGTIIRILNQPVFPPRAKPVDAGKTRPGRAALRTHADRPAVPSGLAPIVVEPMAATEPSPQASTQAMRTLEEVRADLARLREQARSRHAAHAQQRRDLAFAPTDFMDFGQPAIPVASAAAREFPPTDFMDMGAGKPS